jgi:hypothetical protein
MQQHIFCILVNIDGPLKMYINVTHQFNNLKAYKHLKFVIFVQQPMLFLLFYKYKKLNTNTIAVSFLSSSEYYFVYLFSAAL